MWRLIIVCCLLLPSLALSAERLRDLKFGTILFDYHQQNYFNSLIGYEVAKARGELQNQRNEARLLQGGMTLSYGLPQQAEAIFLELLEQQVSKPDQNKAWFYLAKLYYQKGETDKAAATLSQVNGEIPDEIVREYNYLATLINIKNDHLEVAGNSIDMIAKGSVYEPYLRFNLAASQLAAGNLSDSESNFKRVIRYADSHSDEEFVVLADRAKQALAHVDINQGDLLAAWQDLQNVRTTGLYSNRALLSYGWTAIKLERYTQAIPALKALDRRSISIAEVQEAKVLLAHLYEQQGAHRTALKQYLLAEKAFAQGVDAIAGARRVIAGQRIPQEFVRNLEAMMDETDWYGSEPSLDYNKLTPFLIELMSSNPFHIVIKELRDLYALQDNLSYWRRQANEHQLIIRHRQQGWSSESLAKFVSRHQQRKDQMEIMVSELELHSVALNVEEQQRFEPMLEAVRDDFDQMEKMLKKIKRIEKPYRESEEKLAWMAELHNRIDIKLARVNGLIKKLENVMRKVVNAELDKHEERMKYYWAQARLGKARLYDRTLMNLEQVPTAPTEVKP